MGIQSGYISISDLQGLLRDKDTGLPLAAGKLYFFKDSERTIPKDIFILSGSYPNYSFTNIGSTMTLSAIGTYQYMNNDVIPFYYPYDDNGDIELYYISVYNSDDVPQFTRQAVPYIPDSDTSQSDFTNYIPNGQLLSHNNLPATYTGTLYDAGEVRDLSTEIAQGGWYFVRSNNGSTDFVLFQRFDGISSNPTANPRYSIEVSCENAGAGNTYKDLRIRFSNVNKFASDSQEYTFAFTGKSNTGGTTTVNLYSIKNFGTGGTTEIQTLLTSFVLGTSYTLHQFSFVFGTNESDTLGTLDDDYVELALRFPLASVFDASVTDFILTPNAVNVDMFPETPDSTFKYQGIAGFMPTPNADGRDLGLSLILTKAGLTFDDSVVGNVYMASFINDSDYYLPASGGQYETAGYSSIGIPFSRLQAKYFDDTLNLPIYGTGDDYLTCYLSDLSPATQMRISTNKVGAVTDASVGTSDPGFTINTIHTGADYKEYAFKYAADSMDVFGTIIGAVTEAPNAHTSGFAITLVQNEPFQYSRITVTTIAATTLAGTYWTFANTTTKYYMWFTVDGMGANPAPGGYTEIKVDLLSTYTAEEVASCVKEALNGNQITTIVTVPVSHPIPAGSYFNINTVGTEYYVWYRIDGMGTDPAPGGKVGIRVDLVTGDTAAQVAFKTQTAINSKYFKVPNYNNGLFIRGFKASAYWDGTASTSRFSEVTTIYGDELPTMQYFNLQSHQHGYTEFTLPGGGAGGIANGPDYTETPIAAATTATGGFETRPVNSTVYFLIKY